MGAAPSSEEDLKMDITPQMMQSSEASLFFAGSWRDISDDGDATSRIMNLCEDGVMNITTHSEVLWSFS